ncbi:hypothetical protein K2173_018435 [Erythroxylum novogranatense]|uniref:Uncharacterized protein n=1 Tax=Erythroxylum novogranatense TaxID=1862640 RepID=A0AAV8UDA3_9ROSI|nr:hypothetical protein K2173_018435 [Erythroxylum novogranatense]
MASLISLFLQRRLLCTRSNVPHNPSHWNVKQVTKSNFAGSLEEIKSHIATSDFVALSLQNTGSFSAAWHRVSPFDTPETAYLKAKHAAERFQVLQFAVCPFSFRASKVAAHPYNFHLFPRDELNMGMPSYSFSCQTSSLTSMAREGFDFNACIYDGISYLSRAQESAAKVQMEYPIHANFVVRPISNPSLVDKVFIERNKSRVRHWRNVCKDVITGDEEPLVQCLRKIVLSSEEFRSRPCMTIDVCSERQAELIIEMLQDFDDLVPLIILAKGGGAQAVRAVLTSSKEDKNLLMAELQSMEEEHNKKLCGFREVIDLISASQKPVVSYDSLNDLTFVHSKFLAPLPPTMDEFLHSLQLVFPCVVDVSRLMNKIGPPRKARNVPLAMSYLKNHFFAPVDMEFPCQDTGNKIQIHGHNVLDICKLFAKLSYVLKIAPSADSDLRNLASTLENNFNGFSTVPQETTDGEISIWRSNTRKVNCSDLVFLWGFRDDITAGMLKNMLQESHTIFSEAFDLRLVEKSSAIVVFWQPGLSKTFLDMMSNSLEVSGTLLELVSEGMKAAGYEIYDRACKLGLWESSLAEALDKATINPCCSFSPSERNLAQRCQYSELMIDLDDL